MEWPHAREEIVVANSATEAVSALRGGATFVSLNFNITDDALRQVCPAGNGLVTLGLLGRPRATVTRAGARWMSMLTSLETLFLLNIPNLEPFAAYLRASSITSLGIMFGHGIGDAGARLVATIPQLSSLVANGQNIGPEGALALSSCVGLRSLNLERNALDATGVRALATLPMLESVNLNGNLVGDEGASALALVPNLRSLSLEQCGVGCEVACALSRAQSLEDLRLSNFTGGNTRNRVGDLCAVSLASAPRLAWLALDGNPVGDEGAVALARSARLTSLKLSGRRVGDVGVQALAASSTLVALAVPWSSITARGVRAIARSRTLMRCVLPRCAGLRALETNKTILAVDCPLLPRALRAAGRRNLRELVDAFVRRLSRVAGDTEHVVCRVMRFRCGHNMLEYWLPEDVAAAVADLRGEQRTMEDGKVESTAA